MPDPLTGYRIDHRRAKLPPPTANLIEEMARAALEANGAIGILRDRKGRVVNVTWGNATDEVKDALRGEARAMYGVIAKAGGAAVTPLKGGTE